MNRIFGSITVFAAVAACGVARTDAGESSAQDALSLPCDVDAVLGTSCRGCHASPPRFGAPMPLVTYSDLVAPSVTDPSKRVYEKVHERVHADDRPMPPPPNARLTPDSLGALDRWFADGSPGTAASCDGGVAQQPPPSLSCTPDVHLAPAAPWAMPQTTDDEYVCYGVDIAAPSKRHIIGMAPRIDNPAIVHHVVLYQADDAYSPTPQPCAFIAAAKWRMVYVWAPGGRSLELPAVAGFPLEGTAHYVMQVHYNNVLHRPGQTDASGADFCTTTELRPNDADVLAFGPRAFQIPPRSTTDLSCDVKLPSSVGGTLHAFASMAHMHQHGAAISTTRLASETAPEEDLGQVPAWDFQNQYFAPIDATLAPGDTVRTRCVWKNEGDTAVGFGETTADEMCFTFAVYWPRITFPQWTWGSLPLLTHCHPTTP